MNLIEQARAWRDQDPDDQTRAYLDELIEKNDDELADCFAQRLQFGTAGLRGALGPGPNRMNRVVVMQAAAGLAAYLKERHPHECRVVIGFDARHNSDVFAKDTAAIMTGAGIEALVLPRPLPTPVLAYAIKELGCAAGVMVTASHNPPQDNGYKVYLGDGCQIVPPVDADIAAEIDRIASTTTIQDLPLGDTWVTLGDDVLEDYIARAISLITLSQREENASLQAVITPMHGVGGDTLERVLTGAGFPQPERVTEQFAPDPDFPTVAFPNPEEHGAMDLALARASTTKPDLVIANDPDADRCAIAVPTNDDHTEFRMLSGDEVGWVLGWWMALDPQPRKVMAQSIVSGTMLEKIAEDFLLTYQHTLTGFKWIGRIEGLRYGYEEALGYCVDPVAVSDKDGVTAALFVATMAAHLKARGSSLQDQLDDLARRHGVHVTKQISVRVSDLTVIGRVMDQLRSNPPNDIAGFAVEQFTDLELGETLPPTNGLLFGLEHGSRVIIRPSGTEPKVKAYLQAVVPVEGRVTLPQAKEQASERVEHIGQVVSSWLA